MRPTKFLIINGDSDRVIDELLSNNVSNEVLRQIHLNEAPYLTVVECHHTKFEDNLVVLKGEYEDFVFVRSTCGLLFYYEDWWSKEDIINRFE